MPEGSKIQNPESKIINPPSLRRPSGFSYGILTSAGKTLYLAGQTSFDSQGNMVAPGDVVGQYRQILSGHRAVIEQAGGSMQDIVQMTIFVKDRDDYKAHLKELGQVHRDFFGNHYPATALLEISRFFDDGVLVEVQGIAVVGRFTMANGKQYRLDTWVDPRLEVRSSPVAGTGVFAREPIRAGEIVQITGGIPVTEAGLREAFANATEYVNAMQIGEEIHLLANLPRDPAGKLFSMNHSCNSNLWMEDEVTLSARRDIAAGEELTIDYALQTVLPDLLVESECRCGSPNCRHRITGNDWLLPEVQQCYKGHFAPFINGRIAHLKLSQNLT